MIMPPCAVSISEEAAMIILIIYIYALQLGGLQFYLKLQK